MKDGECFNYSAVLVTCSARFYLSAHMTASGALSADDVGRFPRRLRLLCLCRRAVGTLDALNLVSLLREDALQSALI